MRQRTMLFSDAEVVLVAALPPLRIIPQPETSAVRNRRDRKRRERSKEKHVYLHHLEVVSENESCGAPPAGARSLFVELCAFRNSSVLHARGM